MLTKIVAYAAVSCGLLMTLFAYCFGNKRRATINASSNEALSKLTGNTVPASQARLFVQMQINRHATALRRRGWKVEVFRDADDWDVYLTKIGPTPANLAAQQMPGQMIAAVTGVSEPWTLVLGVKLWGWLAGSTYVPAEVMQTNLIVDQIRLTNYIVSDSGASYDTAQLEWIVAKFFGHEIRHCTTKNRFPYGILEYMSVQILTAHISRQGHHKMAVGLYESARIECDAEQAGIAYANEWVSTYGYN